MDGEVTEQRKTEAFRGSPKKRAVDFHISSHIAWLGPGVLLLHHLLINANFKLPVCSQ